MLHACREGHHGKVMRIGDGVDIARKPKRERCEWDALREAATGGRSLDVEGRAAAGLTYGADDTLAQASKSLDQSH